MKENDRYFYIVYKVQMDKYTTADAAFWASTSDGKYVNKGKVEKYVQSLHPGVEIEGIVIMNIIELSESDYKDFQENI
jgi:hypothetical protein